MVAFVSRNWDLPHRKPVEGGHSQAQSFWQKHLGSLGGPKRSQPCSGLLAVPCLSWVAFW